MTMLVRLKPYDPRRGCVLKRFTYKGIKFQSDRGWYSVEDEVAHYLKDVRQRAGDEHASLAFDVCTQEEAKALEAADRSQDPASPEEAIDTTKPKRGRKRNADKG